MDLGTLNRAMGSNVDSAFVGPMNEAMKFADITTVARAAMWYAQIGHESVGLQFMQELGGYDYFTSNYEGRGDLGNVYPGDGARFHGRGPIQLTGRNNYGAFGRWCHERGIINDPNLFVNDPDLVATPKWGFMAAAWYWVVARPRLNEFADQAADPGLEGWQRYEGFKAATRAINGGTNGIDDRQRRFDFCLTLGESLLPEGHTGGGAGETLINQAGEEVEIPYSREAVVQDTYYNCGPASTQTVVFAATGILKPEGEFAVELGTTVNGTDWIGFFPKVLNKHIPGAEYQSVEMPNDPPTADQRERLWNDIKTSVKAGHGVICNIVAPPLNYPRGVYGSISPAYGGGVVYHYISAMGYRDGDQGRAVWIADSGFSPYGYWISLDQLASLIPPKGYAYSNAPANPNIQIKGGPVSLFGHEQVAALNDAKVAAQETNKKLDRLIQQVEYISGQLGPWPQLGQNSKGENLTLVDGVAAARRDIANIQQQIQIIMKGK